MGLKKKIVGEVLEEVAETATKPKKKFIENFIRDATKEEMAENGLSGVLMSKRLTVAGATVLGAGAVIKDSGRTLKEGYSGKHGRIGKISFEENLDRLISYDGSGFADLVDDVAGDDYLAKQDIIQKTFSNPGQGGVSGNIVFALHNRREG